MSGRLCLDCGEPTNRVQNAVRCDLCARSRTLAQAIARQQRRRATPEGREKANASRRRSYVKHREAVLERQGRARRERYATDAVYREALKATWRARYHSDPEFRARCIARSVAANRRKVAEAQKDTADPYENPSRKAGDDVR